MLLAAGGWLGFDRLYGRSGDRPVTWRNLTPAVASARFPRPEERLLESQAELDELLPGAPALDFGRRRGVLVALGPRSSSGYALEVESVREERRRVVVTVRERSPSLGQAVRPGVTYPFLLITIPRADKPVEVEH
jgi:PrcB C-terminal